jgi:hypothetical protein
LDDRDLFSLRKGARGLFEICDLGFSKGRAHPERTGHPDNSSNRIFNGHPAWQAVAEYTIFNNITVPFSQIVIPAGMTKGAGMTFWY